MPLVICIKNFLRCISQDLAHDDSLLRRAIKLAHNDGLMRRAITAATR
jgi:hypothetical protein